MFVRLITRNTHNNMTFGGSNLVVIETPYAGDVKLNNEYTKLCLRDSMINHSENPQALHLIYTKVIDDTIPEQRNIGITKSFDVHKAASKKIYYLDRGFSRGMEDGLVHAINEGVDIEFRVLTKDEKVLDFIDYANSLVESPLNALKFVKSNIEKLKEIAQPVGDKGSYTRYALDTYLDLEAINRAGYKEAYFKDEDRLFMRKLLLETNMSPILTEQMVHQLFSPTLAPRMMNKANGWNSVCDGFAVLVDGMSLSDLITVHYTAKQNGKACSYHSLDKVLDASLKSVDSASNLESIIKTHGRIMPNISNDIHEIKRLKSVASVELAI